MHTLSTHDKPIYAVLGGVGDMLLGLAAALRDPGAAILYCPVPASSAPLALSFAAYFGVPVSVATDAAMLAAIDRGDVHPLHLPYVNGRLDYTDWSRNTGAYIARLTTRLDAAAAAPALHGRPRLLLIAPTGSRRHPFRQRYLSADELQTAIDAYVGDVIVVGTEAERSYYMPEHAEWLSAVDFMDFIHTLTDATHVLSVDTWLKTYGLLTNRPTVVVQSRRHGVTQAYGAALSDYIFLNPQLWPSLQLISASDLVTTVQSL